MSDRERSRSPDRGDPPVADTEKDFPPAAGDEKAPAVSRDDNVNVNSNANSNSNSNSNININSNGDSAPANDSADGAGGGDEIKLYVGNLDYGTLLLLLYHVEILIPPLVASKLKRGNTKVDSRCNITNSFDS
jgi:hypothetical protein